jgi:uncharacterized membrane protein YfcA
MNLGPGEWMVLMMGSLLIGLGKGGLVGVGNLTVVLFAMVFEAKASVGILLPILISADVVAVTVYRRHVAWSYLWKLMPWMTVGIFIGYLAFGYLSDVGVRRFIGGIVLGMTAFQVLRVWAISRGKADFAEKVPHSLGFRSSLGLTGGFVSMVANAAGPIGQLYLISVGLPKLAFIGTAAWCFFMVNLIKFPLQVELGIIHFNSLQLSLVLIPVAMLGALVAPRIVHYIPQRIFSIAVWVVIFFTGLRLLLA